MPCLRVPTRAAVPWIVAVLAALLAPGGNAADPQPYEVTLAATQDTTLDTAIRDSSTLVSLRESAPVGPFALIQRARDDVARFEAVLHGLGYYGGKVTVTIDGRPIGDPALLDRLDAATPMSVPVVVRIDLAGC